MTTVYAPVSSALADAKADLASPDVTPELANAALHLRLSPAGMDASFLARLAIQARLAPDHALNHAARPGLLAASVSLGEITPYLLPHDVIELFREIMRPPFSPAAWSNDDVATLVGLGYQWDFDSSREPRFFHGQPLVLSPAAQELLLSSPWPLSSLAALSPLSDAQFTRLLASAPVAQRYPFFNAALAAATTTPERLAVALDSGYVRLTIDEVRSPWGDLISSLVRSDQDALVVAPVLDATLSVPLLSHAYPFAQIPTPSGRLFDAILDSPFPPDVDDIASIAPHLNLDRLPDWYMARLLLRLPGFFHLCTYTGRRHPIVRPA